MNKGLEALKEIETIHCNGCFHFPKENCPCKIIEKELKALEIIKPLVYLSKGQQHCWLWLGMNGMQITQEQYDLLKEVLDNE